MRTAASGCNASANWAWSPVEIMAAHQRSVIALAEHLLATPLDQLGAREREVIERAVRRHHEPLARAVLPEERRTLAERLAAIGGS